MVTEQESPLETSLRLAADEPSHRPEFFRLLLESSVLILGHGEGEAGGGAGEIAIQQWARGDGSTVIPFFTSPAALRRAIEEERPCLEIPARTLFEMTRGAFLVLNPESSHGKEFAPGEIEALLADGVNYQLEQRVTQEETQVLLGQPADYPDKLVDSLRALFEKQEKVKAAYLALMHDPSVDERPHLIIGIEADGEVEPVIREAGVVVADLAPGGEPIDLMAVRRGDTGLSEYFVEEVKPFYERRRVSRLRSFLGLG